MIDRLTWKIGQEDGFAVVSLDGAVTEDADFAPLTRELADKHRVRFDLSGVARINSWGVREWVHFMRLMAHCDLELEKCPPPVVSHLNMISNFAGRARILSVQAPYICESCGNEENVLVVVTPGVLPEVGAIDCGSCGGKMEFDDIVESYFAFLGPAELS